MAIIKLGVGVADIRGKAGGAVFQKNKGGNFIRTYTKPTNPQSSRQTTVRSRLASLSSSWKGLSQENRDAWNAAAPNFPVYNKVGEQKILSGFQLYQWLNNNRAQFGAGSALTTPPISSEVITASFTGFTASVSGDEMVIAGDSNLNNGTYAVVETTRMLSKGVTNPGNSAFRQIATISGGSSFNGVDVIGGYNDQFGAIVAGQKVLMRIKFINASTGQAVYSTTQAAIIAS